MKTQTPIAEWKHPDGRTITVFDDHKERSGYPNANARPNVHTINQHLVDEWPTLQRATVPNLTDAEWYAAPNEEWSGGFTSLYAELKASGIETASQESDLYFPATPDALAILERYPLEKSNATRFTNEAPPNVGENWVDVPFAYQPFWTAKGMH